ncbi:MAG TPA: hypothetical protein VIV40_25750 [Kofleriaceae bacterium]
MKIRIERLTVDGVHGMDPIAVRAAVERELGRIVASELPQRSAHAERVDGGAHDLPAAPTPTHLGRAVTTSVQQAIRRAGKR